jgi:hypothetical protein
MNRCMREALARSHRKMLLISFYLIELINISFPPLFHLKANNCMISRTQKFEMLPFATAARISLQSQRDRRAIGESSRKGETRPMSVFNSSRTGS